MSYRGAIYHDRRWSDPGNFIYTIWWNLWSQMARHLQRRRPTRQLAKTIEEIRFIAGRVTDTQRMVRNRWTRDPDTTQWLELVGGLMEVALGAGYMDQPRYWCIIAQVSPVIEEIRSTFLFLDNSANIEGDPDGATVMPLKFQRRSHSARSISRRM